MPKSDRKCLTLADKYKLITEFESGATTRNDLMQKYGVKRSAFFKLLNDLFNELLNEARRHVLVEGFEGEEAVENRRFL